MKTTAKTEEELMEFNRKKTKLGAFLEEKRKANKLSFRKAEALTGISHSYIRMVEGGQDVRTGNPIKISIDYLKKFAIAYDCSFEELLDAANYNFDSANGLSPYADDDNAGEKFKKQQREIVSKQRIASIINEGPHDLNIVRMLTKIEDNKLDQIVKGEITPTLEQIHNIAAIYDVTADYLAGYVDKTDAHHPDMPQLTDLLHFINTHGLKLFGLPLNDEQRKQIDTTLKSIYDQAMIQKVKATLESIYATNNKSE